MANTVDYWKGQVIAAIEAEPLLNGMRSVSNTAIYKLLTRVVGTVSFLVEVLVLRYLKEADDTIAANRPGTKSWYIERALEYQHGFSYEIIDNKPQYSDTSSEESIAARVVKVAAVKTTNEGILVVKIGSETTELNTGQLNGFKQYLNDYQFAGVNATALSLPPDKLRANGTVYFNPVYNRSTVIANIIAELETERVGTKFGSYITADKLTDAVQRAEGVEVVNQMFYTGLRSNNSGAVVFPANGVPGWEPDSGRFVLDPSHDLLAELNLLTISELFI